MSFFARCVLVPAALALALIAPACGSDDAPETAPAGSVAVVGDIEIPKSEFDRLIKQAETSYEAQGQEFPKTGSPEFNDLRDAIVSSLVERAEFELEAEEMDIEVTDEEVEKRLDELKKQFFEGDDEKYRKEIAKQNLTDEQVRGEIRARLISEKLYESVASGEEARRTLEANSRSDYRVQLEKELKEVADSEMWKAGAQVRALRPERQ